MTNNLLTTKEAQHKDEIIDLTEEVLHARGLECDDRISNLSEEKLKEILEEVRKLRRRRRTYHNVSDNDSREKEDLLYIK
jgi:ribosomal protein S13